MEQPKSSRNFLLRISAAFYLRRWRLIRVIGASDEGLSVLVSTVRFGSRDGRASFRVKISCFGLATRGCTSEFSAFLRSAAFLNSETSRVALFSSVFTEGFLVRFGNSGNLKDLIVCSSWKKGIRCKNKLPRYPANQIHKNNSTGNSTKNKQAEENGCFKITAQALAVKTATNQPGEYGDRFAKANATAILPKIIGKIVPPRQLQARQIIVIATLPNPINSRMKKLIVSA